MALRVTMTVASAAAAGCDRHPGAVALTDADRQSLIARVVDGEPRLVHATYHFSIKPPPASWLERPSPGTTADDHDSNQVEYVYAAPDHTMMLRVGLLAGVGGDPRSFEAVVHEIEGGFRAAATTATLTPGEITGTDGHLVASFRATMGPATGLLRAHQLVTPGQPPAVVTIMVGGADPSRYADILDSFKP